MTEVNELVPDEINDFLELVADTFKKEFSVLKSSEVHCGRFTIEDLAQEAMRGPAFRVALFEFNPVADSSGTTDLHMSISIAVITGDSARTKKTRFQAANSLVNALGKFLPEHQFAENAFPVTDVHGRNLYSGKLRSKKVQLWEVTFKQVLRVGEYMWQPEDGVTLKSIFLGQAPNIGAAHKDDYTEIISGSEDSE
ncbi:MULTISPECIES: hypothetical protein [unclassified Maridesulfovibrio]|uniref:hypothetical protein n=1 Tax=unclassified Maridesulfovibrio TaxID=2794999 RepID=UPI003B3D8EE5